MSATLTTAANELNDTQRRPRDVMKAASFVLPELKIVYVTNLKVACSTIKWLLAELSGQDPARFYASVGRRPTRAQTVHDRHAWTGVDRLADYDDLSALSADDGWLVFTLVRDPRARLWSAWQSKLLVGNPNYIGAITDEPWYPRLPTDASDVIEDFQRFVEAMSTSGKQLRRIGKDGHFRAQSDLVHHRGLRYTNVYDLAEIPTFERDLAAHLIDVGYDDLPSLRNDNDAPLRLTKDVLAGGVGEAIEELYREDFDRFGVAWEEGPNVHDTVWSDASFADIAFRRAAHLRIRDLSEEARRLAEENARLLPADEQGG
ncbi:MAG: sulfotransferase family 2 domain-containing protein [Nocardioidaceae bacterium]